MAKDASLESETHGILDSTRLDRSPSIIPGRFPMGTGIYGHTP